VATSTQHETNMVRDPDGAHALSSTSRQNGINIVEESPERESGSVLVAA